MEILFYIIALLLILTTILPFINQRHWIFRITDFGKVQFTTLQIFTFFGFMPFLSKNATVLILESALFSCFVYNFFILIKYSRLYGNRISEKYKKNELVSILSANVYQFNKEHYRFIQLIKKVNPDLIFTVESNKDWEKSLEVIEKDYPETYKIPLENTYGMHFYSKLKIENVQVHYFVANDIPSLEVELKDQSGKLFSIFGLHPPPPSPTEEPNSKERDGELLSVAKKISESSKKYLVIGDFNTVSWAKSSKLFKKSSKLIDARIGRGLLSSFHADYRLFSFPIDLVYHSSSIKVETLKVLGNIGSDHLPIYCSFKVQEGEEQARSVEKNLSKHEYNTVNTMIEEGKDYESKRLTRS